MRLSRDSIVLTLVTLGGIFGWLATLPPPPTWTWAQWMGNAAILLGVLTAKLSTSWLRGQDDPNVVTASTLDKIAKSIPVLLLATGLAVGCAPPPQIVTPQGQIAYTADQVVVRVNELQNAAIAAEAHGALPTPTTRTIVQFCVSADRTLAATPAGWKNTVLVAWMETKRRLPPISNPAIVAALGAVDTAMGGIQ